MADSEFAAKLDIAAYCARIGYAGPLTATLATLRAIVARHSAAIPFENIDVLLRRPIRLDLPSLREKLVDQRRGGYCFEHNTLFWHVLRGLGFSVAGLAARVWAGRPPPLTGPRTHMLLRVELAEGPYLADVGFGSLMPTAPVALRAGDEQPTPNEVLRLTPAAGEFDLEARLGDAWARLYRFSLQEQMPIDYEVASWFTSTHPDSLFVRHLVASRPEQDRRYTLFDDRFTIRGRDDGGARRSIADPDDLRDVLARCFAIDIADEGDIAALFALIGERGRAAHPSPFDIR